MRGNYEGKLRGGTVFGSSASRGPAEVRLEPGIKGWTEGVALVPGGPKDP
ncbi:FKBP-type peptidyl-prolyl cis-trans isomerase, partial [Stenotrophomonas maltophilia]